jgi:hypothetical protein
MGQDSLDEVRKPAVVVVKKWDGIEATIRNPEEMTSSGLTEESPLQALWPSTGGCEKNRSLVSCKSHGQ